MTARFSPAARALAAGAGRPATGAVEPGAGTGGTRAGTGEPGAGIEGTAAGSGVLSRRTVLGGAGAAAMAAAFPAGFWRARHRAGHAAPGSGHSPRVVIVGSGLAGLGCAYRLWRRHGIRSEIYEYNPARAGGRVHTLHGFFDAGQFTEQHGEFISSEHSAMRHLAASFGLAMDNVNRYPPHTHPQ